MPSFSLPLPADVTATGSTVSIANNTSSIAVKNTTTGDNIIIATNNTTALTVDNNQNILLSATIPSNLVYNNSKLTVASSDPNGDCLTFYNTLDPTQSGLLTIDTSGYVYLKNTGNRFILPSDNLYINCHDGGTMGLYLGGTLVTSTAYQLNYVNVNPGNAISNKALILDSDSSISGINNLSANYLNGTLTTSYQPNINILDNLNITSSLKINDISVLTTANQLNYNIVSPGSAIPNKSLVLDSNSNIIGINKLSANSLIGTIITSSQPNITSLGTLDYLNVLNNLGIGTNNPSTNLEIKSNNPTIRLSNNNNKVDIYADNNGNLILYPYGNYIDIPSNITMKFGTNSNIISENITATTITGLIFTENQPNIISLGTLTKLNVNGNLSIGLSNTSKKMEIRDNTGNCLRLSISNNIYSDFNLSNNGLSIGSNLIVLGSLSINGNLSGIDTLISSTIVGTLQTAIQPNITTIGTLSSLNVTGNIISGGSLTANFLSGTLSTAAQPNITSIGTLSNLIVTNTINTSSIISDTLVGTLSTSNQPNITSIGTLSNLIVTNTINTSSIISNTLSGTLSTHNQPNITNIGTLINLTVSGSTTIYGDLSAPTFTGLLLSPIQSNITKVGILSSLSISGNLSVNGNVYTTNLAGTLTTASQPNITSIGSLFTLNVINDINTDSIISNTITGILTTTNQSNITQLGVLNELLIASNGYIGIGILAPTKPLDIYSTTKSFIKLNYNTYTAGIDFNSTGDLYITSTSTNNLVLSTGTNLIFDGVAGNIININNIYANNLNGIISTSIQPNITSIGTLTNLKVNNSISIEDKIIINDTDGNYIKIIDNNGYTTINSINGNLYLSPSANNIYLSSNTNIIFDNGTLLGLSTIKLDSIETTIITPQQPNITSLGTLINLSVSGSITTSDITISGNLNGTISTVAQPNITSLGVLTGLNINGAVNINSTIDSSSLTTGSLIISGGIGVAKNINIGGSLVAPKICGIIYTTAQPNITSLGTLTNLTVSGSINGTLSTAAQPNITSLGTLTSLNISGNINAVSLSGTISTSAQPNITSIGTLTGLMVSGCATINNSLNVSSNATIIGNLNVNGSAVISTLTSASNNINVGMNNSLTLAGTGYINTPMLLIGNTTNSSIPLEIGYTSFTFSQSYAYNTSNNSHGIISAGGVTSYNYSIRALGRILCTQSVDVTSDKRLKTNINDLDDEYCNKFVMTTNPVKFNWKKGDKNVSYGYIAQDLLKAGFNDLINLAHEDNLDESIDEDGFINPKNTKFTITYNNIIPILAQNQKYLMNENKKLKNIISELMDTLNNI